MGRRIRQPVSPPRIDRGNALGAKVHTYLPLTPQFQRGTRGEKLVPVAGFAATEKGHSLNAVGAGGGSVPLTLSPIGPQMTVAVTFYWPSYANDDALLMEYSSNYNGTAGGFIVDLNDAGGASVVGFSAGPGPLYSAYQFPRPSVGWHRLMFCVDLTQAQALQAIYMDGVSQTLTSVTGGSTYTANFASTFSNDTLYLQSRGGTTLFGTGKAQDLTFFRGALNADEAASDFANPYQILSTPRVVLVPDVPPVTGRPVKYATKNGFRTWLQTLPPQVGFRGAVHRTTSTPAGVASTDSTGTAAITQAPNTSAGTGTVSVDGTAASTQASNISAGAATNAITGTAADTQNANTTTGTGAVLVSGTAANTQTANTTAAAGAVLVSGTGATSQAANATSATGAVAISGTGTTTGAASTSSGTGAVSISGSAADTQQANTTAGTGAVLVSGAGASTQQLNTTSGAGAVLVSGTAADTQAKNTTAASGAVAITGTAADTQQANVSAAAGAVLVSGSAADTQQPNTTSGTGANLISGSAADLQQPNVSNASGTVSAGNDIVGTAAITSAPDTTAATGAVGISGSAGVTSAPDTSAAAAAVSVDGTALLLQLANISSATSDAGPVGPPDLIGGGGPDEDDNAAHLRKQGAAGRRLYAKDRPETPPEPDPQPVEAKVAPKPIAPQKPAAENESLASVVETVELSEDDDEEAILMMLLQL